MGKIKTLSNTVSKPFTQYQNTRLGTHRHLRPGHTALYGLITAKARQNVISREADKITSNQILSFIQSGDKKRKIKLTNLFTLLDLFDFVCFRGYYILTGFGRDQAIKSCVTGDLHTGCFRNHVPTLCTNIWFVCLFVCFESHEQFFSYLATVTITDDGAANLVLCLALTAFSSEGSFTCHTYCDTGPPFLRSYPKDP
jgi:hypothetical protein